MNDTEITNKAKVFFMDDDPKNVIATKEFGVKSVLVNKCEIEYIQQAFNFLYEFNEKHEIYVDLEHPHTEPLFSDEDNSSSELINAIPFEPLPNGEYTPWESND